MAIAPIRGCIGVDPLGVTREEAWLCYLIPYPCMNSNQEKAVDRCYQPEVSRYRFPKCTVPSITQTKHAFQWNRCTEIMQEIIESHCDTIILLGDLPIKYWLAHHTKFRKLADFGDTDERYGRMHDIKVNGRDFNILPLVSPQQAGKFGRANKHWYSLHAQWMAQKKIDLNAIIRTMDGKQLPDMWCTIR